MTISCILQEPRKSDAPQLRDEYRSYKILSGCRESLHQSTIMKISSRLTIIFGLFGSARHDSWNPSSLLLWTRGSSQHLGDRSLGSFHGRSVRHVWTKVLGQDLRHGREADGE